MKKFTLIGLVIVLLAFSAIPVFAAGPNNGHGKGNGAGQNSSTGDRTQTRQQDKDQNRNNSHGRSSNPGAKGSRSQSNSRMRTPFYLQGTIKSINTANRTVTITVVHANAKAKQFIGTDLVVAVPNTTMIFKIDQGDESESSKTVTPSFSTAPSTSPSDEENPGDRSAITFSGLADKDIVAIHGNVVGGVYTATVVTVYMHLAGIQPEVDQP